ncbi:MAG: LysR family transcriptional regulator, partial [Anaerovibrio sp.]|nr:LysR family transcriptional regulator [Anaerovibrio sp.]
MELHQLEYFRALAHIKHFTNTSKAIAVSQPALSRSMAKLESELGVALFDRKDKHLDLTDAGRKFLEYVEKGLYQIEAGKKAITATHANTGTVRLAFIQSLGGYFVPQLLSQFREQYPQISFSLTQDNPLSLGEQLRDGKTDLCLCSAMVSVERVGW